VDRPPTRSAIRATAMRSPSVTNGTIRYAGTPQRMTTPN
jgi:hypothetical protein